MQKIEVTGCSSVSLLAPWSPYPWQPAGIQLPQPLFLDVFGASKLTAGSCFSAELIDLTWQHFKQRYPKLRIPIVKVYPVQIYSVLFYTILQSCCLIMKFPNFIQVRNIIFHDPNHTKNHQSQQNPRLAWRLLDGLCFSELDFFLHDFLEGVLRLRWIIMLG